MNVQLWSCNFYPEPTGIGLVSGEWTKAMTGLGHQVSVVAAHPHYPLACWGSRRTPYRETTPYGVQVVRLPLWIGREKGFHRIRQDISFASWLLTVGPFLSRSDAIVAVSPSFPALAPAVVASKLWRCPLVIWLQDILPDGAVTTGLLNEGVALSTARYYERWAYRNAERIVVISDSHRENLIAKDVPQRKIRKVFNPATLPLIQQARNPERRQGISRSILLMGNIGKSQSVDKVIEVFQNGLGQLPDVKLVITGYGVAFRDAERAIKSPQVSLVGLLDEDELQCELGKATLGVVSQNANIKEFNLPSKLMNYLAQGLPVIAVVAPEGHIAKFIRDTDSGWVVDARHPEMFPTVLAEALNDLDELHRRGQAGLRFARKNLTPEACARQFEAAIQEAVEEYRR